MLYSHIEIIMSKHKTVSVSDFKAHCLEYVQTAQQQCQEYIITKRNIPVARLVPLEKEKPIRYGPMAGTVTIHGDMMSPIDVEWEALKNGGWENLSDVD
jgi:prevent-host-death family protein